MKEIIHRGTIEKVCDRKVWVRISRQSACVSCSIARHCNVSETKEEYILVESHSQDWREGQEVHVRIAASLAGMAVVWAYVLPVVLLLLALIGASFFRKSDGWAALFALGVLVIYYGILFCCKRLLQRKIRFSITPM